MTRFATSIGGLLAIALVSAGLAGAESDGPQPRTALVIDAALARDGRDLVDPRLADVDAEIRLPRTRAEARTNLRYFDAQGYRLVVAGTRATDAAGAIGVPAVRSAGLPAAIAALAAP